MRARFLIALFVALLPVAAHGQPAVEHAANVPLAAAPFSAGLSSLSVDQSPPVMHPPSSHGRRCCNEKGALVGFVIGAGLGIAAVHYFCDAGDCRSDYFKAAVFLGALGAGIGAFASPTRPQGFPLNRRVTASAVLSSQVQSGTVAVRF